MSSWYIRTQKLSRKSREADISIGTFYHHFRSKKDILACYVREESRRSGIEVGEFSRRLAPELMRDLATGCARDLSRRILTVRLDPFSLREYLSFHFDDFVEPLSLKNALFEPLKTTHLRAAGHFKGYLSGGLYPFFLETGASVEQFGSILETILKKDIPNFDTHITTEKLFQLEKTVTFIGTSPVDGINYSSISGNVGITKYKAEKFLALLESCFIARRIFPRGTNVLKEPKVVMELPYRLLFKSYDTCIGELREDFFALAMRQHDKPFFMLKPPGDKKPPIILLI